MQTSKKITRAKKSFRELFFKANEHQNLEDVKYVWENADFKLLQSLTTEKDNLKAYFSLLNANRTKELTLDVHISCYSTGFYNSGAFINAKSTIFSLCAEVPDSFVESKGKKIDGYQNLLVNYKKFPVGYFFQKSSQLRFNKPITKLTFKVDKGDVVTLLECDDIQEKFVSSKEQDLVLKGSIQEHRSGTTYHNVDDYELIFDDIDVENHYKTFTDIGGKWLCINSEKVAHLGNGFGDGRYTLRFSKGKLVR